MAFLSLSRLPWSLHLSGQLFYFFYQTLIDEAERFHFIRVGLHCSQCVRRPVVYVVWRILHPWQIGVAPACVPSRYHQ